MLRTSEALAAVKETRSVPLFDLKRQQARLRADIDARMARVLDHGQFVLGPEVETLEKDLAAFAGARHCIAVSSGRDALIMALMALGAGPGDAVFVPAFTFSATAGVVSSVGAVPVFVDVDEATYNMVPAAFEQALNETVAGGALRPLAVMPVDLYGLPADYPAISEIAARHGVNVIADAAQSFGGTLGEKSVGALAPMSCTSFYPTKPLGAFGDGGAVFTEDDQLAEAVRQIRTHGRQGDGDEAVRLGMTGRLDTLQAAVLNSKLSVFADELARRREVAKRYDAALQSVVELPARPAGMESAWALYTIRVPNRDQIRERLQADGVGTGLFYRIPLHRHPAFAKYLTGREDLPVSDRLAGEVLSLPMGPDLTDEEVDYVVDRLRAALG
ncbi:DegT/DnrJ/EryC1/StrS family aminotransferase [Amorphus orientalis]|uniref:dTDP-4-amino-4,6-dideoxygalactose transaminase n=1 Tax=Amorphus orientalis TaxID=649198 RepID=A0AAE3VMF3_9HYPH|nr:DegT/DnrJ/EryC1/StrS family aminotransferase [Amorphus orientalis]MDQ0314809.1 dTDP-4-amino-4,6-dideoxygalactose transaminase [Amorphus orientalis]